MFCMRNGLQWVAVVVAQNMGTRTYFNTESISSTTFCALVVDFTALKQPTTFTFAPCISDIKTLYYPTDARIYEDKSLNNRNFIITFFTRVLTEVFCVLFSDTVPPRFATHSVHLSTSLRMPSRKKSFLARPLTNFAPPPIPCRHLQTCGPANVLSQVQTSDSHTAVCIQNLHSSVDFRRFHTL